MEDYYTLMGIDPDADSIEIKRIFRKLARIYHPDKNNDINNEEKFKQILLAYKTLIDPKKRIQYDSWLAFNSSRAMQKYHEQPLFRYATYQRKESIVRSALIEAYWSYFKWICITGVVITFLLTIDYIVPYRVSNEKILRIEQIYLVTREQDKIHNYDILFTEEGREVRLIGEEATYFRGFQTIRVYHTFLFFITVFVSSENTLQTVPISLIYGNLSFIPVLLFLVSILGLVVRSNRDLQFSCSIVACILLFILFFLILTG